MSSKELTVIHWFRKGLRIHDNPALLDAISEVTKKGFVLRPIFMLDPDIVKWMKVGCNRWRFLKQSLEQLDTNLRKINSRLYVVRGTPTITFPKLFKLWNVKLLTFEFDTEPYAIKRDEQVEDLATRAGVKVVQKISNTIYDVRSVIKKNAGSAPLTYQKFLSVVETLSAPIPLESPSDLPNYSKPSKDSEEINNDLCYDTPSYEELGVKESDLGPCLFPGGETEAITRLEKHIKNKSWICKFEKPNTSPNSLEPSTTVLSPYIKFGCLSSRLFYSKLKTTIANSAHSKPPVSLIGQLMWREFYYTVGFNTNNFDKMVGNPVCCQIPWNDNEDHLKAWSEGKTGYPFIDAIMRQLKQEGWIHHLARHAVACFLTRGDLWISWEKGQQVFEEYLLDADWALNAGNWMWLSASAFFHQFFRVYSPVAFGKKTDKTGEYIKKYVPELAKYNSEYIYEPWKAPISYQKSVNCVLGKDYPHRIVIHEDVYKLNINKMSIAYKNKKTESESVKRKADNTSQNKKKKT